MTELYSGAGEYGSGANQLASASRS
ncbi:hypothetical protein [Microbacterium sp. W4I4]